MFTFCLSFFFSTLSISSSKADPPDPNDTVYSGDVDNDDGDVWAKLVAVARMAAGAVAGASGAVAVVVTDGDDDDFVAGAGITAGGVAGAAGATVDDDDGV